jgi:RHS repeat-associated protein
MDAGWQVVPAASFSKQQVTIPTVTAKQAGYIFVYLSYEDQSNNYVYFDDFKVTITPTNIVQNNEYYAHGLPTSNSWTRDNAVANNFLANGGTELNATSSLYDLDYRNYDPILGRLNQVDPMASRYSSSSPYHFSFNNPIGFNDPSGADPFIHPPDEPYDWFGLNSGMGRDQAWNKGGGTVRTDGKGGYFNDTNGDGIQNGDETIISTSDIKAIYGENAVTVIDNVESVETRNGVAGYYEADYVNLYVNNPTKMLLEVNSGKFVSFSSILNARSASSIWFDVWNSPVARYFVPDYFVFEVGAGGGAIFGIQGSGNYSLVLRGKDPGLYKNQTEGYNGFSGAGTNVNAKIGYGYFLTLYAQNVEAADILEGDQISGDLGLAVKPGIGVAGGVGVNVGLGPGGANSITFSVWGNAGFGVETPIDVSVGYGTSSTPVPIFKF